MSDGGNIPPAANVLGTLGTVCWCIQLLPQIWTNWRTKSTEGLPGLMMLIWYVCAMPFGAYAIIQQFNIALQIQPQIFGSLCLITYMQTLVYHNGWSGRKATVVGILMACIAGGVEIGLVLGLRIPYGKGTTWPVLLVGIIGAVLISIGAVPPYFELAKRQGRVIGINFWFLAIDLLGAVFSLFSLVAQRHFDVLGGTQYSVVAVLEVGVFASHAIWMLRTRKVRREATSLSMSYDDFTKFTESERGRDVADVQSDCVHAIHEEPVRSKTNMYTDFPC